VTVRVVLADDQPLIRAALRVIIADAPDLDVVGEAETGADAVRLATEVRPDVILMDIRMPVMDGINACRAITTGTTRARVLILTTFDDQEYLYGALRAGASGFLVKDMALDDILAAIRVVAAGDALLAPSVTRRLIEAFVKQSTPTDQPLPAGRAGGLLDRITEREREVLILIARGMSNAEIAENLIISVATAKAHVARLLSKLAARDRVQLVILAYQAGLMGPPGRG
jgi:DNA-binding NarL/FixJ family response regulator